MNWTEDPSLSTKGGKEELPVLLVSDTTTYCCLAVIILMYHGRLVSLVEWHDEQANSQVVVQPSGCCQSSNFRGRTHQTQVTNGRESSSEIESDKEHDGMAPRSPHRTVVEYAVRPSPWHVRLRSGPGEEVTVYCSFLTDLTAPYDGGTHPYRAKD